MLWNAGVASLELALFGDDDNLVLVSENVLRTLGMDLMDDCSSNQ